MKCGYLLVVMFFILLLRLFEIQLVGDLGIGTCVLSKWPHCAEGVPVLSHLKMPQSSPVCAQHPAICRYLRVFGRGSHVAIISHLQFQGLQVAQATLELTTLLPLSTTCSPPPPSKWVTYKGSYRINAVADKSWWTMPMSYV